MVADLFVALPAERRATITDQYDAFVVGCPSRQLFDRISDKWVGLTLSALADGSHRYGELSRAISGVSQKMLTQTLRNLERDGLVARRVTPTVPVRVDYELTALGHDLLPTVWAVKAWAEANVENVEKARAAFDAAASG